MYLHHYEDSASLSARPNQVWKFIDDHKSFSSHMSESSWMMGGGKMRVDIDSGKGQKVGSHIKLSGKVCGFNLFLDEIVTKYNPPKYKAWKTVGNLNLLIIDHYQMGVEIKPSKSGSLLKVFIDYNLPQSIKTRWLGLLMGNWYAKWCVGQMIIGVKTHFSKGGDLS